MAGLNDLVALALLILAAASPLLALSCLSCAPILVWSSRRFKRQSNDAYLAVRDRIGAMLARLSESLNGIRVIQAYAREPVEIERFGEANRSLLAAHMSARGWRVIAANLPADLARKVANEGSAAAGASRPTTGAQGWAPARGARPLGATYC